MIKNLFLKNVKSFFIKILIRKKILIKTKHKSGRKGPLINSKGIKEIKKAGKLINICSLMFGIKIIKCI